MKFYCVNICEGSFHYPMQFFRSALLILYRFYKKILIFENALSSKQKTKTLLFPLLSTTNKGIRES